MPRKKYFWTAEQDELLRRKYSHLTAAIDELSKLLPYPRHAITHRAQVLGLARTKEPRWTMREEAFLNRWISHRSVDWIAQKLKRTVTASALKAKRIGIKKSGAGHTAIGLAMILGVDQHKVAGWIEDGRLRASRRKTGRHGGQNGDYYYIDPADAREFLIKNPDEFSIRTVAKRPFIELLAGRLHDHLQSRR